MAWPLAVLPEKYVRLTHARIVQHLTSFLSQTKKVINYVESGDEEDEDEEAFMPTRASSKSKGRQLKRRRTKEVSEEEDIFQDNENHTEDPDEGE